VRRQRVVPQRVPRRLRQNRAMTPDLTFRSSAAQHRSGAAPERRPFFAALTAGAVVVIATAAAAQPAPAPGAAATSPGLVYRSLREGSGASPTAADTVKVNYRGLLLDGIEFDSSYKRNEPATFPLGRVIPCWTEGVQRMKVGGKAELVCPPELAYGARGAGGLIPPNATLRFEIELLAINPR
jgi:FKBP-type peptidyl-prolyl cis-trans isomerase FkpA